MKDEGRGWAKDEGERRKAEGDTPQSKIQNPKSKILLADDNADMRRYVQQLLSVATKSTRPVMVKPPSRLRGRTRRIWYWPMS